MPKIQYNHRVSVSPIQAPLRRFFSFFPFLFVVGGSVLRSGGRICMSRYFSLTIFLSKNLIASHLKLTFPTYSMIFVPWRNGEGGVRESGSSESIAISYLPWPLPVSQTPHCIRHNPRCETQPVRKKESDNEKIFRIRYTVCAPRCKLSKGIMSSSIESCEWGIPVAV